MPAQLHNTKFPTATDCDLNQAVLMLKERFERFYPQIEYRVLNDGTVTPHEGEIQDRSPATSFDDLWGEPMPSGQQTGLAWENPHTSDTIDATEQEKYLDGVMLNARINHNPSERALQKYGIDEKNTIMVLFLVEILNDNSITIKHGDRFFWKFHMFEIMKWSRQGYWKNTSEHLYIEAVAKLARYGD